MCPIDVPTASRTNIEHGIVNSDGFKGVVQIWPVVAMKGLQGLLVVAMLKYFLKEVVLPCNFT